MFVTGTKTFEVAPSAARLTGSLRDIGYDFTTAVADLVDNSVAAGATHINVFTQFEPTVRTCSSAMTADGMTEASAG